MARYIALAAILLMATAEAEVYRWVAPDGSVHYSDRPQPGAETVTLPSAQTFKAPVVNRRASSTPAAEPAPAFEYRLVEIIRPIEEEVLWNTGGQIDVSVRVEPELQPGHKLVLFLDEERIDGENQNDTQFQLSEVYRGQHELRAEVRGAAGTRLAQSRPVSFTVQQTSQLNPNNPNTGAP